MKNNHSVLYINAMGPTEQFPNGGVFVTQRIRALQKLAKVDIIPVSLFLSYTKLAKFLLRIRAGVQNPGKALSRQMDITYDIFPVKFSLIELFRAGHVTPRAYYAKSKATITKMLQKYPDVQLIHMHWMWPCGIALPDIAREYSIPYVITCHGSEINITMRQKSFRDEIIHILEKASCVEFVSRALLNTAIELGYSGENAVVANNGIDVECFRGKRSPHTTNTVGFVGNLIPVKGADRLPGLFQKIYQGMQGNVEFLVAGDGALRQNLEQEMEELPVVFCGFVPPGQLADVYAKMDVLLVPSRNEGYGCVVKEAQACGVIPVGADVGGIAEAVGDYGDVITANKGEEELVFEMAEAVVSYLRGEKTVETDAMVQAARECSWENQQKKSVGIYYDALGPKVDNNAYLRKLHSKGSKCR